MSNELHVILGTGPVGCWTARALIERGLAFAPSTVPASGPQLMPAAVEMVAADVSDPAAAVAAAGGATTIYQALNPPYHQWHELFPGLQAGALAAAKATGARYVSIENLYMYDSSGVMTEESPIAPVSRKGELRQRMAEEVMRPPRARRGPRRGAPLERLLRPGRDRLGPWASGSSATWWRAGRRRWRIAHPAALLRLHRGRGSSGGRAGHRATTCSAASGSRRMRPRRRRGRWSRRRASCSGVRPKSVPSRR